MADGWPPIAGLWGGEGVGVLSVWRLRCALIFLTIRCRLTCAIHQPPAGHSQRRAVSMCLRVHVCVSVFVCSCVWVSVCAGVIRRLQPERTALMSKIQRYLFCSACCRANRKSRKRGRKGVLNAIRMCVLHGTTWLCISFDMTGAHNDLLRWPKVTFTLFVAAVFHVSDLSMQKIEFHIPCDTTRYDLCSAIVWSLLCGCVRVCVCMLCVFAIIMRCHVLCLRSFSDRKLIV